MNTSYLDDFFKYMNKRSFDYFRYNFYPTLINTFNPFETDHKCQENETDF